MPPGIQTYCESVFRQPSGNLDNFECKGRPQKHSARYCDYVVGGLRFICTPYQTGVEYVCFFLAALV